MVQPLMPKATAVWLIDNTALTFEQIADFCAMHALEVQAIADGEVAIGIVGLDPLSNGQLTGEEIERCANDPAAKLEMATPDIPIPSGKPRGPRYTPVSKRQERPDAIAWLLREYPELTVGQICKLVGTTKTTVTAVRERTHWKAASIKPRDPIELGMCSYDELVAAVERARRTQKKNRPAEAAKSETPEQGDPPT
ncbi:MAG: DUF1013 domain-containing protein [Proteobacteria bacterium]|nr:DUF1013 domain-containing protein [Pseudomonadota bacterium]